jgi:tRNA G18 (ribose-2'-O)-methylase SpoU
MPGRARDRSHAAPVRVTSRNARFQQWEALLGNRTKRTRSGEFVVQGVRPISLAVSQGWTIRALLHDGRPAPSPWAADLWSSLDTARYLVSPELMQALGEKSAGTPELLAIAEMPPDELSRIRGTPDLLVPVFDRPASPGNVGTLIRSADAFGASGLVITGHAADPYDPKCIRASTGSIFSLPVVRAGSHREVLDWVERLRADDLPVLIAGTDEHGSGDLRDVDLGQPVVLVIGNETAGLTAAWRDSCDLMLRVPMAGTASSLNAATAGSIVLYEAMMRRRSAASASAGGS